MIKKLRKKFILIALGVVAAVIISIVVGIDVANYANMVKDADNIVDGIATGSVVRPDESFEEMGGARPGAPVEPGQTNGPKGLPRETAFSARYFVVQTNEEGEITGRDLKSIAYVKSEDLATFVEKADSSRGFVGDYRYGKYKNESGSYVYIFLDCEKEIEACRDFIISSIIVTVVGLVIIAILIVFLSKKALKPVEESYERQKQFITDAGHELKTPLTVISANAELLELEIGDNEWIKSIQGQVKKLSKLTKDLVFLSRMDEGGGNLPTSKFSLDIALTEVAEGFKEAALVAGKSFTIRSEGTEVTANEEMIRRALGLILDNAIKYAESEDITVTLKKEGKTAVIEETNVSSLPKGAHPELFERFYRPDASRSNATGGHGIGLSVVQSVFAAHKGSVSCVSDGTKVTFRLELPLASA